MPLYRHHRWHPLDHISQSLYRIHDPQSIHLGRENGHFTDDISKYFVLTKGILFDSNFTDICSRGQVYNNFTLVKLMAWHQTNQKSLRGPISTKFFADSFYSSMSVSHNAWQSSTSSRSRVSFQKIPWTNAVTIATLSTKAYTPPRYGILFQKENS